MDENSYKIKTEKFEGPLELLLSLIESRKLFINDISLAEVTNEYVEYIRSKTGSKIENITSFISVASTLILIKARSLLPSMSLTQEEKDDVSVLKERIFLYKKVVESVEHLQQILKGKDRREFVSLKERPINPVFAPSSDINIQNIELSIRNVLDAIPKEEPKLQEVSVKVTIGIEDMINRITDRIEKALNTSFSDFCKSETHGKNKEEVKVVTIVSFLAMLELIKEGIIDALQNNTFEDMTIVKREDRNDELEAVIE